MLASGFCLIAVLPAIVSTVMRDVVFDGSAIPEEQGWSIGGSGLIPPFPFFSNGAAYDMNTIGAPSFGEPFHLWSKDVGITTKAGFVIEISLKVIDDTLGHNQYDAGIAFFGKYTPSAFGLASERAQMIYFDEDEIGWGDETDTFALDTTDRFHLYRLEVQSNGFAQLYVDGTLALERTGFMINGVIAFGDQTNDDGVDGHFQLAYITVGDRCPGNTNGDDVVDVSDLLAVVSNFGECPAKGVCVGDLNGDGSVDVQDLLMVVMNFGACPGVPTCSGHASCDDNDDCTIDLCLQGVCHHIPIHGPGCD